MVRRIAGHCRYSTKHTKKVRNAEHAEGAENSLSYLLCTAIRKNLCVARRFSGVFQGPATIKTSSHALEEEGDKRMRGIRG